MRLASITLSAVVLSAISFAGSGGIQPPNGNYGFIRSDGTPVGSGRFTSNGQVTINSGTGGAQTWERKAPPTGDGQYRPMPASGRSLCIQPGGTMTYQYKLNGDVVSTGTLES